MELPFWYEMDYIHVNTINSKYYIYYYDTKYTILLSRDDYICNPERNFHTITR